MYRILISLFIMGAVLSGCNQQELKKLKEENESLKAKVVSLDQELVALKETDQNYFNRGIDTLKTATSKPALQSALDTFTQLVEKFPKSQHVPEARQHSAEIKQQISNMDQVETGKSKLEAALETQKFDVASAELRKLKPLISNEGYKSLSKLIYEEQNKPIEADMRDIAAEPLHYVGKRLKLKLVVVGNEISRSSFRTHPYSNNITGLDPDVSVEVFYDEVSDKSTWRHLESNRRPMISVIGVFNIYGNDWSKGYIKAESISSL